MNLITKFPSDPKYFGPGIWFTLHTLALKSNTQESITIFINIVQTIINSLPCSSCKEHSEDFYKKNPPDLFRNFIYNGRYLGMFKWTCIFHNSVNLRLRKVMITFEISLNIYDNKNEICNLNCGY